MSTIAQNKSVSLFQWSKAKLECNAKNDRCCTKFDYVHWFVSVYLKRHAKRNVTQDKGIVIFDNKHHVFDNKITTLVYEHKDLK